MSSRATTHDRVITIPTGVIEDQVAAYLYATKQLNDHQDVEIEFVKVGPESSTLKLIIKEEVKGLNTG